MADYQQFSWGGIQFPLPASTANTLLSEADPSLSYAIDFFAFSLRTYIGARLLAELDGQKIVNAQGAAIADVVQTMLPIDPVEHATSGQYPFPLLAVWRVRGDSEQITTVHARDDTTWSLLYVLPPMTAAQGERIKPIFHAVRLLLQRMTQAGWDPAYVPPGYTPGPSGDPHPQVWKLAGLDRIDVGACEYCDLTTPGDGTMRFPALSMTIVVKERGVSYQGLDTLRGVSASVNIQPPDGSAALDGVAEVDTWVAIPKPGA